MLQNFIPILAAEDDAIGKIIFAVIFGLIWGISALVSWWNKQQQAARRRAALNQPPMRAAMQSPVQIAEGLAQRFPEVAMPPRPAPPQRASMQSPVQIAEGLAQRFPEVAMPPRPAPLPRKVQPPRKVVKPAKNARRGQQIRQIAPQPVAPPPLPQPTVTPPRLIAAPAPVKRAIVADARTIALWLRPQTMKSQFVLTEILRPPVALRNDESVL